MSEIYYVSNYRIAITEFIIIEDSLHFIHFMKTHKSLY